VIAASWQERVIAASWQERVIAASWQERVIVASCQEQVSDCCLAPSELFVSYFTARTSYFLMR
jgi:hypothetical protein